KYKGDFNKMADYIYSNSFVVNKQKVDQFLNNPTQKQLANDPAFQLVNSIMENYQQNIAPKLAESNAKLARANRLYVAGLRQMNPDKVYYPDANSTIRLSYGSVKNYKPYDGVTYETFTTMEGIMQKEDPSNEEFIVPAKLKQLYEAKDYGRYANKDGELIVNFITDNDITGGNSGSPVINGKGELIGLAFDGNWEAMTGDLVYDPDYKRCINVSANYVLFMVDKYAGASNLINEMTIVNTDSPGPADASVAAGASDNGSVELLNAAIEEAKDELAAGKKSVKIKKKDGKRRATVEVKN
ncbi:MAG: S46 family peptidase, partial [Hymenobacteraceae bacterium]|nr:S46 family peptidase [Hymenobacteraceae bacterium]